jgi:hypothetical protein
VTVFCPESDRIGMWQRASDTRSLSFPRCPRICLSDHRNSFLDNSCATAKFLTNGVHCPTIYGSISKTAPSLFTHVEERAQRADGKRTHSRPRSSQNDVILPKQMFPKADGFEISFRHHIPPPFHFGLWTQGDITDIVS